jgi:microcystin-dependent protein
MADPFVAEIRIFPFTFAPRGWAFCNGQILPISQNTALFALLGTFYGGNGQSTFALPNLQGSSPVHQGQGPGLSTYDLGQQGGSENITLLTSEIPFHTHTAMGNSGLGDTPGPGADRSLARYANAYQTNTSQSLVQMAFQSLTPAGGSLPHNNMMPYLTLNFNIAMQGVFPPRS